MVGSSSLIKIALMNPCKVFEGKFLPFFVQALAIIIALFWTLTPTALATGAYALPLPAEPGDPEDAADCPFRHLGIVVERARIGLEVFIGTELERIDKNAHDGLLVFLPGAPDET